MSCHSFGPAILIHSTHRLTQLHLQQHLEVANEILPARHPDLSKKNRSASLVNRAVARWLNRNTFCQSSKTLKKNHLHMIIYAGVLEFNGFLLLAGEKTC